MLSDLRASRIFKHVAPEVAARVIASGSRRRLEAGTTLARQGDPARGFVLLERGYLKLLQLTPEGASVVVRFVGPGEPFGGVTALDEGRYPVTAVAVTPVQLLSWTREDFRRVVNGVPALRANLMQEMADHMTEAMTRAQELATTRLGPRLARTLLRVARLGERQPDGAIVVAHPVTRQDFADMTGATLHTVSRTLAQWQADGILAPARGRLVIRDAEGLRRLAAEPARSAP